MRKRTGHRGSPEVTPLQRSAFRVARIGGWLAGVGGLGIMLAPVFDNSSVQQRSVALQEAREDLPTITEVLDNQTLETKPALEARDEVITESTAVMQDLETQQNWLVGGAVTFAVGTALGAASVKLKPR